MSLAEYQTQGRRLLKSLNDQSPPYSTLETNGPFCFHYIIKQNVCYLVLAERSYPKKLAFLYLENLQAHFSENNGSQIDSVARPYAFIEFDTYIQATKKQYQDSRSKANLDKLNDELRDVADIMSQNIRDVVGRGRQLNDISSMASRLAMDSKTLYTDAKYLNFLEKYRKYAPAVAVGGVVMIVIYLRLFWFY